MPNSNGIAVPHFMRNPIPGAELDSDWLYNWHLVKINITEALKADQAFKNGSLSHHATTVQVDSSRDNELRSITEVHASDNTERSYLYYQR